MLVPNTPRSQLPGVFITGESRLPGVLTTGESRLPGVFTTGESTFWTWRVVSLNLRSVQQSLKRMSFLKLTEGYFNYLGSCDLCLKKIASLKDSNQLPGVFITGESITNTNNSNNIQHRVWMCLLGPGEVV